ncbi:hypothetical protein C5167_027594 [Papaver somniferum]|nr:hypothetical protein C5167_027594 [Papaver somniferum]
MEHQEIGNFQAVDTNKSEETKKKKKELSMKARIQRNKHARQNWKIKLKRRKLEQKGQMGANVEEKDQMAVPNVNQVAQESQQGPDYRDFSTVEIRQEKIALQ